MRPTRGRAVLHDVRRAPAAPAPGLRARTRQVARTGCPPATPARISSRSCWPSTTGGLPDGQHHVALAQAGAFGGAARHHLADAPAASSGPMMPTLRNSCASASRDSIRLSGSSTRARRAAAVASSQPHVAAVEGAARQQPAQVLERPHRLPAPRPRSRRCSTTLAAAQPGLLGHASRPPGWPARACGSCTPIPVDGRVQQHRQQQVGGRPGGHDGGARPQRLGVEGAGGAPRARPGLRARRASSRSRPAERRRSRTRCPGRAAACCGCQR